MNRQNDLERSENRRLTSWSFFLREEPGTRDSTAVRHDEPESYTRRFAIVTPRVVWH